MSQVSVLGTEIPANEAVSGEIDLDCKQLIAIELPATWAGTSITFLSKANRHEDETDNPALEVWKDVYDDGGNEVTVTVAANRIVAITGTDAEALAPLRYLRIRSGTAAAPVNQNPSKVIRVISKQS